jgi:uncharacterized protein
MKQFIPIIFLIIFLGILISANIYLSRRFSFFFNINNVKVLYVISGLLTVSMITGVIANSNSVSNAGSIFYITAGLLMGVLLYLLLSTITIDILRLFTNFKPVVYGVLVISITLALSIYGVWNSYNLKVNKIDIHIEQLNKSVKIMHLSDIHLGHFRGKNWLEHIVKKTNENNVEAVFITGDLFDGRINLNNSTLDPLRKLNAPVYFVEGNHDNYSGIQTIKKHLRETGVIVLENELTMLGELQIIGLNHMLADTDAVNMHPGSNSQTIRSVLPQLNINEELPSILLHHSPDGIKYANDSGINVYLAGHTHAGQLFPITYIAKLIFPYNKGLHNYNNTKIFVSQGAGTFGPPMRIGTESEITLINLMPLN